MTTGPTNLYDLATELMSVAAEALADADNPQSNQFIWCGTDAPPAFCATLAVSFEIMFAGRPGYPEQPLRTPTLAQRSAILKVWSYRCLTMGIPAGAGAQGLAEQDADGMNADALAVMTDAYVIMKGITTAHLEGGGGRFRDFTTSIAVGPSAPIEMQGMIGGCVVAVTAELS